MSDNEQASKWLGVSVSIGLVFFILVGIGIPLAISVFAVSLIPEVGTLRDGITVWSLLHALWMIPVFYLISAIVEAFTKVLVPIFSQNHRVRQTVHTIAEWTFTTPLLLLYFDNYLGASLSALLTMLLWLALTPWIDRETDKLEDM